MKSGGQQPLPFSGLLLFVFSGLLVVFSGLLLVVFSVQPLSLYGFLLVFAFQPLSLAFQLGRAELLVVVSFRPRIFSVRLLVWLFVVSFQPRILYAWLFLLVFFSFLRLVFFSRPLFGVDPL